MRKPNLLFLCQTLPFPPDGGVNIRSFNVLRLLARNYNIVMLCFYRANDRPSQNDVQAGIDGLSRYATVEAYPIPQEWSRFRLAFDHARSLLWRQPYTRYAYSSEPFLERLQYWLRAMHFPLVHMDSLDLLAYLPLLESSNTICVHHNVESILLRRRGESAKNPFRRLYLRHQAELLERAERRWCPKVALNVAVSPGDAIALATLAPTGRYAVVPNGVDTDLFQPSSGVTQGIVFVGGANWFPNRDGLEYFASSILPLIRNECEHIRVRWIGRASAELQQEYSHKHGIELTGYLDDVRPTVLEASCYVVPLRVGGGTRLKILDAWAMGKAVVSTSIGCEGLEAVDGDNILIRDDPASFASAVLAVLNDEELRLRLGRGARKTAETLYSWDSIETQMVREYRKVLEPS